MDETYNERVYRIWLHTPSSKHSLCNKCKAEIIWMKTERGKNIPVDKLKFIVKDNANKEMTLLDIHGIIHRTPAKGVVGFRPHWVTCPKADQFRSPHPNPLPKGEGIGATHEA